jgi:shikimate dehydrogenase
VRDLLDRAGIAPATRFVLRGSGGMAKAVAAALRDRGHGDGTIVARNEASGAALAAAYGFRWSAAAEAPGAALLVNATPIGMSGGAEAGEMPFAPAAIAACRVAFEVVAIPAITPFLTAARAAGKATIAGADVAVLQALEQFVLYTGVTPDEAQVADAAAFARAG